MTITPVSVNTSTTHNFLSIPLTREPDPFKRSRHFLTNARSNPFVKDPERQIKTITMLRSRNLTRSDLCVKTSLALEVTPSEQLLFHCLEGVSD